MRRGSAPGVRRTVRCVMAIIALVLTVRAAHAQGPAASSALGADAPGDLRSGHTWLFDRFARGEDGVLVHVPPRDQRVGVMVARSARTLAERPEVLVAAGDRVFLFSPARREPAQAGAPRQPRVPVVSYVARSVSSLTAERVGPGGWTYAPEGRTQSQPSLLGAGVIQSATALDGGPLVLMSSEADGQRTLQWLDDRAWRALELPPDVAANGALALCSIVERAGGHGVLLITAAAGAADLEVRTAALERTAPAGGRGEPAARLVWDPAARRISNRGAQGAPVVGDVGALRCAMLDGSLVAWGESATGVQVYRLSGERVVPVARIEGVPPGSVVVPVQGLARLAVLTHVADDAPGSGLSSVVPPTREPVYDVREVSVLDGAELFNGRTRKAGLLSARDVWLVGMALAMLMVVVLLFVLRRDTAAATVALPEGAALASPVRRLIAACLDNLLAIYLSTVLTGVPLSALAGSQVYVDPQQVIELLGGAAAVGLAMSTLAEWFMGRTPGKLLAGIAVIGLSRAHPGAPAGTPGDPGAIVGSTRIGWPTLRQALLRNIVKWGLPPLTVFLLFDSALRHPGDLLSRTLVIEPLPPADASTPE